MEKVKETTSRKNSSAPMQIDEQPALPEKMSGPQMLSHLPATKVQLQPDSMPPAARASEMLTSPQGELGAPTRARMGSMLQRQVGNMRVGKMSGARAPAPPVPVPSLALTPHDEMVRASLLQTLERFQNIPIFVGFKPLPPDLIGPPEPVIVHVHAQYYINKPELQEQIQKKRSKYGFYDRHGMNGIITALQHHGIMSVLEGGKGPRATGRAVEYGKASPEDIKAFVEEAIARGVIEKYATDRKKFEKGKKGQQLVDLPHKVLENLIQDWMKETAIGVDCSGFVQQALIREREEERTMVSDLNSLLGTFGIPALPLPAEIKREEVGAGAFKTEDKYKIKRPTELRPGDAWVLHNGGHVRIVVDVRESTNKGKPTIEFDTVESTGDINQPDPGIKKRTWHTSSMKNIGLEGAFYHTLSSDKLTKK